MAETKKTLPPSTGPANQTQLRFNEDACSDKVSETGFNYFYGASNAEGLLGALNTAKRCGKFKPVMVFNVSAAVVYVKFGDSTVTAPTGGADGVPIPPNNYVVLASGQNEFVISNVATTFGYAAKENVSE